MSDQTSPTARLRSSGFSLASLMVLVSFCAVLMAGLRAVVYNVEVGELLLTAGVGGFLCGLLGAIVGVSHFRRRRGAVFGFLSGSLVGLICCPLSLLDQSWFFVVSITYCLGAVFLVAACWLLLVFPNQRTVQSEGSVESIQDDVGSKPVSNTE